MFDDPLLRLLLPGPHLWAVVPPPRRLSPGERRDIWLSALEVRYSWLTLEELLQAEGIDVTQPYERIDMPHLRASRFVQPPFPAPPHEETTP